MICKYCNQENENGSRFCASCGRQLEIPEEINRMGANSFNNPPDKPGKPLTIALFVCIIPYAIKLLYSKMKTLSKCLAISIFIKA